MHFYYASAEIFHLLLYLYGLPFVIIFTVLIFPKTSRVKDVSFPLILSIQSYLFYFVWVIRIKTKYDWQPSFLYKFIKTKDYRYYLKEMREYDYLYIILDSINIPLLFLNIIITSLAIYYVAASSTSYGYLRNATVSLIFSMVLMNILFTTANLAVFYVLFELLIIPLFFLIGLGTRARRLRAVTLFFMYTVIFSYVMLFGLLYAWVWFGTLHYPALLVIFSTMVEPGFPLYLFWITLLIAFLAKIPLVPFHIWLPEAHVEATAVGSVMLAGLVLKIGAYAIIRFLVPLASFFNSEVLFVSLAGISLFSAVYATIMTFFQVDFKKIIAYSSIAHLSFAIAGVFTLSKYGLAGGYFLNIGHGFVSAALFFLAGMLYRRYGTRLIKYYSGLGSLPYLSSFLLFFSFSNIAFPGTATFVAEFLILLDIIHTCNIYLIILIFIIFVGSLFFSIWMYLRLTGGPISHHVFPVHYDLEPYERNILYILGVFVLITGLLPSIFFFDIFRITY